MEGDRGEIENPTDAGGDQGVGYRLGVRGGDGEDREANVEFALKHPQLGRKFADYLRRRVAEGLEHL